MANTIQIKRRVSGGAGAPSSLKSGEVAYNEVDDVLYYGKGDDGGGNATSIATIAGIGALVALTGAQTIAGVKTFSSLPLVSADATTGNQLVRKSQLDAAVGGDMEKATYDTNDDGKVDAADSADAVPWSGVTGKPSTFTPASHSHVIGDTTGLQAALDDKAPLASPALTGTPTAPTAAPATNTTQIATTAFVEAAISALMDGAPGALDTLNELAAAMGDDPDFAATITNELAGKLAIASNLADLNDAATARGNLGLGSIATQAANSVAITGGTIDGITLDGGTF